MNDTEYINDIYHSELDFQNYKIEINEVTKIMKEMEENYLKNFDPEIIKTKKNKIKEFLLELQSKEFISEQDYKKLKTFSLETAGFITNENRQKIYNHIFFYKFNENIMNVLKINISDENDDDSTMIEEEIHKKSKFFK